MHKAWLVGAASLVALVACFVFLSRSQTTAKAAMISQSPSAEDAFYTAHVAPVLQANCLRCHGGMNHRGGLSMSNREGLLKGGKSGPAIVPGHPEQSLLVRLVRQENLTADQRPMPLKGKLSSSEIATLEEWIRMGAAMPPIQ